MKNGLLFFLLLSGAMRLCAQEYSYAHYDVKDGLASSVVYDAVNDKDGFMWFATETGLSRFDGTQFRNFTIQDGLPDNEIMKLFVDSKGRLWIMPFRNAICYYYNGKIHTRANDTFLRAVSLSAPAISIAEDKHGNLLITEPYGVHLLRPDGTCKVFSAKTAGLAFALRSGLNKKGNFIFAGGGATVPGFALYEIVRDSLQFTKKLYEYTPNSPNSIILSPDLQVFRKSQEVEAITRDTTFYFPVPGQFIGVSRLPGNMLSINGIEGSYVYNLTNGKLIGTHVKDRLATAVIPDHEGNWWFCTHGQGVFRLISAGFQNFSLSGKKPAGVYSIAKYNSDLYFGSEGYKLFYRANMRQTHKTLPALSGTGRVTSIVKPDSRDIMIGTDFGLFLYRNEKKIAHLRTITVKSLCLKGNELLIAAHVGVYNVRAADLGIIDTIWTRRSTCAWRMNDADYVGTLNGLLRISKGAVTDLGKTDPVLSRRITSMAEGSDGILWIGTYGEGVIGVKDGKTKHIFSEKNGLSSNNCRALFIQGNNLWVGTEKGLNKVRMNPEPQVTKYTMADGLASDIINTIYVDKDTAYVGTAEGLTIFNESNISQQSTCILRMTGINTGSTNWTHDTANFLIPHNNRLLEFDFSGISFKSAGDITYYFRLAGLNNEWQTTRSSFLSYPSLPSGEYRLELYAVNKFGIKSNALVIPFMVEKIIWEKTWFKVLAGLLLIAAVWMFIVFRLRVLRRREQAARQMEKRMVELEQMALKAQMNPHFIFNSLNSIQQYVLENDFKGVNAFITGFASLVRQTLEVSSKPKISLEEELNYISTYLKLEKMRLEDKFTYEINVSNDIVVSDYFIPPLILQPCLENSIRHGIRYRKDKNGRITVNVLKDNTCLICSIEDNGIGRKLAGQYKGARHIEYQSKGMSLTASRIAMLTGNPHTRPSVNWEDITREDGTVAGTRVTIRLPLEDVS